MIALPRFIELETSRYCNRRCEWCPNGGSTSRTIQELMPWTLFARITRELQDLDYQGWIALHNYNEPLANPRLFEEIDLLRQRLASAKPCIFTNGDLLRLETVHRLRDAGVRYLRVTRYPRLSKAGAPPIGEDITAWLAKTDLAAEADWTTAQVRQGLAASAEIGEMAIEVIAPDISTYNWRGNTTITALGAERLLPCSFTRNSAAIDYQGRLKMCCNIYPDESSHAAYVVGSLAERSFAELWDSSKMKQWRLLHAEADWSASPICQRCVHYLPEQHRQSESKAAVLEGNRDA